jgi:hypothetical protein
MQDILPTATILNPYKKRPIRIIQFVFIMNEDSYLGGASCAISRNDNHPVGLVLS